MTVSNAVPAWPQFRTERVVRSTRPLYPIAGLEPLLTRQALLPKERSLACEADALPNYEQLMFKRYVHRPERALIRVAWLGFTTTYKTAGTAKLRGSRARHRMLWVGLWVGKSP